MLRIGPSGNSLSFYESGHKNTYEAAEWLHSLSLTAFEYSFGRGVNITHDTAAKIKSEFKRYGIEISAHAPYYTNFANTSDEMIDKSIDYIRQSVDALKQMGGNRVVFHPASCGKLPRREAVALAAKNISKMMQVLEEDCILCPETMGKMNQIGTVEEIVEFCKLDDRLVPCFDFGHINSYTRGGLKGYDDYKRIIDYTVAELGEEKAKKLHVHFSKIMYGAKGELKHLTFADQIYGPEYAPLARVLDDYGINAYIICESDGTMAEDAITMRGMHRRQGEQKC